MTSHTHVILARCTTPTIFESSQKQDIQTAAQALGVASIRSGNHSPR